VATKLAEHFLNRRFVLREVPTNDGQLERSSAPSTMLTLLTWTNSNRDLYGGRNSTWTLASGAGGHYVIWDRGSGIVMVILDSNRCFYPPDLRVGGRATKLKPVIDVLEAHISGTDPFAGTCT